jgi:hypothetical protein
MIEGAGGARPSIQELAGEAHRIDRLRLDFARKLRLFVRDRGNEDFDGYESPIEVLRECAHMSWHSANQVFSVAMHLDELPEALAAVERGEIGFDHLAVICELKSSLRDPATWDRLSEATLIADARGRTVTEYRKHVEKMRHTIDAEGFLEDQVQMIENRRLSLRKDSSGVLWLKGVLDPAGGAIVVNALEPLARRSGPKDDRPREQRLADALVEFAEHGSGHAQLQVTATLETLRQLPGVPAGELLSVPVSARTVERLSCDCTLTRVVLGSESVVIDVGRRKRIVSAPGRRALQARDQTCRWPGCSRPGSWCTPHHLVPWSKGGSTDLDNQVLVCSRHHWMLHEGGWQMVIAGDGRVMVVPPPMPTYCRGPDLPEAA